MKKIIYLLFLVPLLHTAAFSQGAKKALTKEQKLSDSIAFEKFRKENPERFLNNRLPVKLMDGAYAVIGYSTGIKIESTHIKDSVYHNFQPGMPDTSTVIPFSDIKVTDQHLAINLFSHLLLSGSKDRNSSSIVPVEESDIKKNWNLPLGDFFTNEVLIKISLNGKLLFDWKSINKFPKYVYRISENFNHNGGMFDYSYGYAICDTNINIHDQLLVEIKSLKNNWMIDRYNITRVAASPNISFITSGDKVLVNNENTLHQKKTSLLALQKTK